jgi:hypothetical protein
LDLPCEVKRAVDYEICRERAILAQRNGAVLGISYGRVGDGAKGVGDSRIGYDL